MIKRGRLEITEEKKDYIEKYWAPIEKLNDSDAEEIVQEYIADKITYASWSDDEEIYYEYEDGEYECGDAPYPAFTPEYLRYIGMSMRDFV